MNKKSKETYREQSIRIALPERHWVVLLALLDQFIGKSVKPALEDLIKKGVKLEEIDDIQSATLAGPIMIRGLIIKELAARGIIKPEANWQMGIDKIMAGVDEFKKAIADGKPKRK
jgi:hypothetical protein